MQPDNWGVISWVLIGNLIIDGIAIFVIQKFFENRMNRNLEEFKAALSSQLQKEHIRLSTNYPKLAETMDELNLKLIQVEKSLAEIERIWNSFHPDPNAGGTDEIIRQALTAFAQYKGFTRDKTFHFPADLSGAIVYLDLNLFLVEGMVREVQQKHTTEIVLNLRGLFNDTVQGVRQSIYAVRRECRKLIDGVE